MNEHYHPDGEPKKCRACGSESFKDVVKDFVDVGVPGGGPPTEVEWRCSSCDSVVGYWAYGSFDSGFEV